MVFIQALVPIDRLIVHIAVPEDDSRCENFKKDMEDMILGAREETERDVEAASQNEDKLYQIIKLSKQREHIEAEKNLNLYVIWIFHF